MCPHQASDDVPVPQQRAKMVDGLNRIKHTFIKCKGGLCGMLCAQNSFEPDIMMTRIFNVYLHPQLQQEPKR